MPTTLLSLTDVIECARPIVERIVWCSVATVGPAGPRSRLMHPVWSWTDEPPTALVTARPTAIKIRHLAAHPFVSCSYWDPAHDTVTIDAAARWLDARERRAAWDQIASVPPPVGFDPGVIWPDGPDAEDFAVIRLTAVRIVATPVGRPGLRWSAPRSN